MKNTEHKGHIAELKTLVRAAEKGWIASRPTISARYDLILDDGMRLWKVQVKYGNGRTSYSVGAAMVELRRHGRKYTKEEIDAIIVYLPVVDALCWIPGEVFNQRGQICIRYAPSKNGQIAKCLMASDYLW